MIDMGFEVDASTAGSSVRFQPPDPALRSISFHKRKCPVVCLIFAGLSDFHPRNSSSGEYDRPDHSAKVGQEAKELLWVVGGDPPAARQSTILNICIASTLGTVEGIIHRSRNKPLLNMNPNGRCQWSFLFLFVSIASSKAA
jgi:hypothetical protein